MHKQLLSAIEFIEEHLASTFSMDDVADAANFSLYHFHRLFTAYAGDTPAEYIRKRRLSRAARELVFTANPISLIARTYGFTSQEAFTRAFAKLYGVTPGKLRREPRGFTYHHPLPYNKYGKKGEKMKPRIEVIPDMLVGGMKTVTTQATNDIFMLWGKFNQRCGEIDSLKINPNKCYGVCYSMEGCEMNEHTPFSYLAGFEVSSDRNLPEGFESRLVKGGKFAIFEHVGPLDTLDKTYAAIFNKWLDEAGLEVDRRDDFELYDERFKMGAPDSVFEIWVPVK